jgi:hypothetical protein
MSRRLLDSSLRDLAGRLAQQVQVCEAIVNANKPNGQHTVVEHQLRTMYDLMLDNQLQSFRQLQRMTHHLLCADRAP